MSSLHRKKKKKEQSADLGIRGLSGGSKHKVAFYWIALLRPPRHVFKKWPRVAKARSNRPSQSIKCFRVGSLSCESQIRTAFGLVNMEKTKGWYLQRTGSGSANGERCADCSFRQPRGSAGRRAGKTNLFRSAFQAGLSPPAIMTSASSPITFFQKWLTSWWPLQTG